MTRFCRRWLTGALGVSVAALLLHPHSAFAFKQPICPNICTSPSTPTLSAPYGGLRHAEIAPIFWGDYWNSNPSSVWSMVGMIQGVVNGPYIGGLAQYGGASWHIGTARMIPGTPIRPGTVSGDTNTTHTTAQIVAVDLPLVQAQINAAIGATQVPHPDSFADVLYTVFLPPGSPGFPFSYNTQGKCDASCGSAYNGKTYTMAWVGGGSPLPAHLNDYSGGFTHEMAEAITQNVTVTNCGSNNQIGDVCLCYWNASGPNAAGPVTNPSDSRLQQLGVNYAPYWSAADGACVIPEGWAGVYSWNGSAFNWSQINTGTVRQVYAGGYGLFATNTSDNIMRYSSGTTWNVIGGQGSMFAVGNGLNGATIMDIAPNAGSIWLYSGSGSNWTQIDGPASAVYGGNGMFGTDFSGNSYQYSGQGMNWNWIAGPSDQLAPTGSGDVYAVGLDHNVWKYTGSPGNWSNVFTGVSQLYPGVEYDIALSKLASTKDTYYLTQGTSNWLRQAGQALDLAVSYDSTLFWLDPSGNYTSSSNNTAITNPSWTQIASTSFGRLVNGGWDLYAVGPPVY
jgi:hypothetical protein